MKIGILTAGFTGVIGAQDFINQIILALTQKTKETGDELFILTSQYEKKYRQYSGLKYFLYKVLYKIQIMKGYQLVKNIKNVKINEKNIKNVLKRFKIDCVLPLKDLNIDLGDTSFIRYLYDCQHKYYPEFFSENEINCRDNYFQEMVKEYCIVNSMDAKNDFVKYYNANPNKMFALPFTPKIKEEYILYENQNVLNKYKLPKRYFLMSCQFWLHKNHSTLFKAFKEFSKIQQFSDIELVCTGTMEEPRKPEYINELKSLIKDLGIKNKVHLLGCIPKKDQMEIIKNSIAVINTTLFEGGPGGGSTWDACALGVRSLISDIPVNLEIKNDLVYFFKAKDSNSLCNQMQKIASQKKPDFTKEYLLQKNRENIKYLGDTLYEDICTVLKNKI